MRILLLMPERYSLLRIFKDAFTSRGADIYGIDFRNFVKTWEKQFNVQVFRLPDKLRLRWESYFLDKINRYFREEYSRIEPDIVFIYNSELLLPETIRFFRKKSKVAFFLGDNPFYTPVNRYFLDLLFYADAVFAPDTFWISQLKKTGLNNLHYLLPGIPGHDYYEKSLLPQQYSALKTDVLYVGLCYTDSWGYKKARFLSHFTDFDLQIHGNRHWKRWFRFFPALEGHFREKQDYIPTETLNDMYNAAKIIPVDGNPGVLKGIHLRALEALGAGALPLLEWQDDLSEIFGPAASLPAVKDFHEIPEMARYYLNNEDARREKVAWMKKVVESKFSAEQLGDQIFSSLNTERRMKVQNPG